MAKKTTPPLIPIADLPPSEPVLPATSEPEGAPAKPKRNPYSLMKKLALLDGLAAQGITRHPRKCTRFIKKENRLCERWAIAGGNVCMIHGGSAPQVQKAAKARLLELVDTRIARLEEISDQSIHMPSALGATQAILNRALGKVGDGPKHADKSGPTINIGISLSGRNTDVQAITVAPSLPPAIDAEDYLDGEDVDDFDE